MESKMSRQQNIRCYHQSAVLKLLVVLLCAPCCPWASSGDQSVLFHGCLGKCLVTGCTSLDIGTEVQGSSHCSAVCANRNIPVNTTSLGAQRARGDAGDSTDSIIPATSTNKTKIPIPLRIFHWSCTDDCKYHCMHAVESFKAATSRGPVEKYYGKWPFIPILGMQEFASVLASIANLATHALCLRRLRLRAQTPPPSTTSPKPPSKLPYPFLTLWTAYGSFHILAWACSALFHARDTPLTERIDYAAAISLIALGLFSSLSRALWAPTPWRRAVVFAAGISTAAGAAVHLHYMLLINFDYGWNMRVCVSVGCSTAALWLGWCFLTRHPARLRMLVFILLVHGAMLLEVLDFPPLGGLLDAHAAWHVATVPLTALFYSWLGADMASWEAGRKEA